MKTRHITIVLLFLFLILSIPIKAQEMTVKSMVHDPLDQAANLSENLIKDNMVFI